MVDPEGGGGGGGGGGAFEGLIINVEFCDDNSGSSKRMLVKQFSEYEGSIEGSSCSIVTPVC